MQNLSNASCHKDASFERCQRVKNQGNEKKYSFLISIVMGWSGNGKVM